MTVSILSHRIARTCCALERCGEGSRLGSRSEDAGLVAQPLEGRGGDGDRALPRVVRRTVAERGAEGREQPVRGVDDLRPGVEDEEVARAAGVLALARG